MKKHGKALIGLIAVFAIVFGIGAFFVKNMSFEQQKEDKVITEDAGENPESVAAIKALIEKSNKAKFTILEIVPDMSVAELGYIDMTQAPATDWIALCQQGLAKNLLKNLGLEYSETKKWKIDEKTYKEYEEKYGSEAWWEDTWKDVTKEGKEVQYQCKYSYYENEGNDSTFNKLVDAIDNGSDKIAILAVTSAQLNGGGDSATALLEHTDMVYVHQNNEFSFSADNNALDLNWSVVRKIFREIAVREDSNGNFDPMAILFDKSVYTKAISAGKNVSPIQYTLNRAKRALEKTSYETKTANGSNNNVCKLYIMSMFRDATEFYNLFLTSVAANGNQSYIEDGKFTIQSGDAQDYWNSYTFLPTEEELKADGTYNYKKADASYWSSLRIDHNGAANSNGSAYAVDVFPAPNTEDSSASSDKTLSKQWDGEKKLDDLQDALGYEPKMKITKKDYKVLDIEPAPYSDSNAKKEALQKSIAEKIIRLCPYQEYETVDGIHVTVESVTTAEFIGRQEDIVSTYDFVYIGACTDSLWMGASQDTSMKDVIYAHTGAKVAASAPKWDPYVLYSKPDRVYYSGNDITKLKSKQLKAFLDTGYPIVISSDLLNASGKADSSKFNELSKNNMYAFINGVMDEKQVLPENFDYRTKSAEEANKFLKGLDMKKPELYIDSYINGKGKDAVIDNTGSLSIRFHVKDKYDTDTKRTYYVAKLYIDKNADGLYNSSELFAKSGSFRGNGATVTLKKGLNTSYRGALTWKLEVVKLENGSETAIKACEVGYNTIRGGSQNMINVLQIMSDSDQAISSWASEKENGTTLNMQTDAGFQSYLNKSEVKNDYAFNIKSIRMKEFDGYKDILENYDILIFGFADSYIDKNLTPAAAKKVHEYIELGHSVLFTHDLTSQQMSKNCYGSGYELAKTGVEKFTGYNFTQYFRETMGMNRFAYPHYENVTDGTFKNKLKSEIGKKSHDATDKTAYGYTYGALMQYGLMPAVYSGGSKEFQGPYKDMYMNTYSHKGNFQNVDGTGYTTTRVENVNDGQITKYPFNLSGLTPDIAETHSQYYQLNMEDPDVVVWYTLSGAKGAANGNDGNWYTKSPRDVSNNYYIYNKGNVTYSGVGHRKGMTDFEYRLFVNTIVASLRAGIEGPQVNVTNASFNEADECYYMQADIDEDAADKAYSGYEEIEFNVTDDSSKASDRMYIRLADLVPKTAAEMTPATAEPTTPTATLEPNNSVTIYYDNGSDVTVPVVHYHIGSDPWTSGGTDVTMASSTEQTGYRWKATIPLGAETHIQLVFKNGGAWDNNRKANYNLDNGVYCIKAGSETTSGNIVKIASGGGGDTPYDTTATSKYKEDAVKTGVYKITGPNVGATTIDGEKYIVVNRSTDAQTYTYTIQYPRENFKGVDDENKIVSRALRITARNSKKLKSHADVVISRRSVFNLD